MRLVAVLVCLAACGDEPYDGRSPDAGPGRARVDLPPVIALPYVAAGAGAATLDLHVVNTGDHVGDLGWGLTGAGFTLVAAPATLAPDEHGVVTVRWDGSAAETIASATLTVEGDVSDVAEVWAVAGDPALDAASFDPVMNPGGVEIGESAVVSMPAAPYPAPGRTWIDDRVHLFVPEDYREADAHDLVLHFHGHNTTIDATVPAHRYREQVHASGANVILVVPQGPVNAASGDFGKLSDPAATAVFLDEVLIVLYRAGVITRPVLGDVILTSHSGGYVATAQNLAGPFVVRQVQLYDSIYGYLTTFRDYALDGGRLRSNYTPTGGTDTNNQSLAQQLETAGATVSTAPTAAAMLDPAPLIYGVSTSHQASTRIDGAYGEHLRWGARRGRDGPRAEVRSVVVDGGLGTITWIAPADPDLEGWRVQTPEGDLVAGASGDVGDETSLSFSIAGPYPTGELTRIRLVPWGPAFAEGQPSNTYAVADSDILVVDGFDRVIDGSFGGLSHDFAARVAEAAGGAHAASNEAITENGFGLSAYRVVIWLVGDGSTDDHTFTAAERAAISAYVTGGGRVILSGSEIGYDLSSIPGGATFLSSVAGATYASDDAGSNSARGVGALGSIAAFLFGSDDAPYPEEYPDTFTGTAVLVYATGAAAAVGVAGQGVAVGFPLETIADDTALAAVVAALIAFVDQ